MKRRNSRRPDIKIAAIGGGTGLSTMLRGLKKYTKNLTAIVTVVYIFEIDAIHFRLYLCRRFRNVDGHHMLLCLHAQSKRQSKKGS